MEPGEKITTFVAPSPVPLAWMPCGLERCQPLFGISAGMQASGRFPSGAPQMPVIC